MSADGGTPSITQIPKEFFTASTFGTLAGCAVVTWIVSGVLGSVFRTNPKVMGLVVAIVVAYVGLFLSSEKRKAQYVVALFNGFLIYATVVGATSFLPYLNPKTAEIASTKSQTLAANLSAPWVPDHNLVVATHELTAENQVLQVTMNEQVKTLTETKQELLTIQEKLQQPVLDRRLITDRVSRAVDNIEKTNQIIRANPEAMERIRP